MTYQYIDKEELDKVPWNTVVETRNVKVEQAEDLEQTLSWFRGYIKEINIYLGGREDDYT